MVMVSHTNRHLGEAPARLSKVGCLNYFFLFGSVCLGQNFRTKGYSQGTIGQSCLISFHLFLTPLKNWFSRTDPTWTHILPGLSLPANFL